VYPGCTWNVLTLNVTGYQTALVQELERYNIAIAGLTEARLQDSDLSTVDEQDWIVWFKDLNEQLLYQAS